MAEKLETDGLNLKKSQPRDSGSVSVNDKIVDVEIASEFFAKTYSMNIGEWTTGKKHHAKLNISTWTLNNDHYFTIMATKISATTASSSGTCSPTTTRTATESNVLPMTLATPSSQMTSDAILPRTTSYDMSKINSAGQYANLSLSSTTDEASVNTPPLTNVEKMLRLQDSLIDAMDVPIIAMWRDESVLTINKALSRLTYQGADEAYSNDVFKVLSSFKVYTEDFGRELTPEEYPIVQVCRFGSAQTKFKVGILDSNHQRRLFEFAVDRIYDDKTREFQAVIVVMKDITWYTETIKAQGEESEQQFQLICETLPQMVGYFHL